MDWREKVELEVRKAKENKWGRVEIIVREGKVVMVESKLTYQIEEVKNGQRTGRV